MWFKNIQLFSRYPKRRGDMSNVWKWKLHFPIIIHGNIFFRYVFSLFRINPKWLWIFQPSKKEDLQNSCTNNRLCQSLFNLRQLRQPKFGICITFDKDCNKIPCNKVRHNIIPYHNMSHYKPLLLRTEQILRMETQWFQSLFTWFRCRIATLDFSMEFNIISTVSHINRSLHQWT